MHDVIIVGSGPAGVAAAMSIKDKANTLILDVGYGLDEEEIPSGNFYDKTYRQRYHRELIGSDYSFLTHLNGQDTMVKLRAPAFAHILARNSVTRDVKADGFNPLVSFAKGGLANAWGAQLYEYFDEDLVGFPLTHSQLRPYYQRLYREIGISGTNDDLHAFYGKGTNLLPQHHLSQLGLKWMARYQRARKTLNQKGVFLGRPRLGLRTVGEGRHEYNNLEFIKAEQESIYTPLQSLRQMEASNTVQYKPGYYVEKIVEQEEAVSVFARSVRTADAKVFQAKKVMLAAGAINTAGIVLRSNNDYSSRLPILDNPLSYIPFVDPFSLGIGTQERSYYNQINLMYQTDAVNDPVMGTFYAINGIYNSEFLTDLPFDIRSNIVAAKCLLPAMMVLHLWYPNRRECLASLSLESDNRLLITHAPNQLGNVERQLISKLRRIGIVSHPSLCKYPEAGNSIHYAGTLPMTRNPKRYQTYPDGRLFNTENVYVIDGAVLPTIAAKNHSFTIMANAMRIADQAVRKTNE